MSRLSFLLPPLALLLAACQPPAPGVVPRLACGAAAAGYALDADARFRARFLLPPVPAGVESPYVLELATPARSYWFRIAMSNGYGGMTLVPVRDPRLADAESGVQDLQQDAAGLEAYMGIAERLRFYTLGPQLEFLDYPPDPRAGRDQAPPFLAMPELGNLLWYEPGLLDGQAGAPRQMMPRGLFRLVSCGDAPPPPAPRQAAASLGT